MKVSINKAKKTLLGNRRKGYTLPTNNKLYTAQWNWDSGFIALGYSYFNLNFALKEINTLLDGQWKDFVTNIAPIKVKLFGPIKWTFKRDVLWSDHGPVLKTKHGVYAIRFSGYNLVGQMEQWYRMNKANNLVDFKTAMQMMQIPMFNT